MASLVTVARALQNPGINRIASSGDFDNPLWLENLLEAATSKVEDYCGRKFLLKAYSERLNGSGLNQMFLTVVPLFSVESVTVYETDGTSTVYDTASNFVFDEQSGQVRWAPWSTDLSYFPEGFQNILIQYIGGYYLVAPQAVQDAIIQVALAIASQSRESNDLALGAETPGDYRDGLRATASTRGIYSWAVVNMLEQYRTIGSGLLTELEEVIGPQGPQGELTFRGPQGFQGVLGAQGFTGVQGYQGYQGAQGLEGAQGWQGSQGVQGAQGGQGAQGWMGSQGYQGWQGSQGWQGDTGTQGFIGDQGAQGWQGTQGWQGGQGRQGRTGNQGFQGWQGVQGWQGNQGAQGGSGVQGYQGAQGEGVQGPQGEVGAQGAQGPA